MVETDTSAEQSSSSPRKTAWHLGLIVALCGSVFFTNLGGAKLWDRDEPRNAGCAREMLQRNDWVTPYFNGELRTHKPVLTYWLMMTAYGLFGVTEFSARFWSAALGVGTCLATYVIARRLFAPLVGFWAALVVGTSLLFCVASRAATPDAPLIFCSTMAIMCYVVGTFRHKDHTEENSPPQTRLPGKYFPNWLMAALMYAWMGLGMLAKGPVGLVLPTAVIGMFLLLVRLPPAEKLADSQRSWTRWHTLALLALSAEMFVIDRIHGGLLAFAAFACAIICYGAFNPSSLSRRLVLPFAPRRFLAVCWSMRPLTAMAVALAIAAPWYFWVGLRTNGAWLEEFVLTHNLSRATHAMEGHTGTYFFYPVSMLAGLFPWSILLAPALIALVSQIRRRENWMIGYLFAACWLGVYVAMFSLAKTKLPSYVTPAYPALAMVVGAYIVRWQQGRQLVSVWMPRLTFGALAVVGVAMSVGLTIAAMRFFPSEMWLGLVGLIPILAAGCGYYFAVIDRPKSSAASFVGCGALVLIVGFGVAGPCVSTQQPIDELLGKIESSSERPLLAAHRVREPSWIFYSGRSIPMIGQRESGDVTDFLKQPDAFVFTTDRAHSGLKQILPADVQIIARKKSFLRNHDVIVLGRSPEAVQLARENVGDIQIR